MSESPGIEAAPMRAVRPQAGMCVHVRAVLDQFRHRTPVRVQYSERQSRYALFASSVRICASIDQGDGSRRIATVKRIDKCGIKVRSAHHGPNPISISSGSNMSQSQVCPRLFIPRTWPKARPFR
jgi:hypothetical protein